MANLAGGKSRMMTKRTPSTMNRGGKTAIKKKKMTAGGRTNSSGASAYGAKPKAKMRSGGKTPMKRRGGKTKC
jgi:hypothetical protein